MWYEKHLPSDSSTPCKGNKCTVFSFLFPSSNSQNKIPVWQLLPLMAGLLPFVGVTFTYYIAKTQCHLERWILPYVSFTGNSQPESMVFGILFNIEAFICIWISVISWRYYKTKGQQGLLNNLNFLFGVIASFGVIIIANFQITAATTVHFIGAAILFIVGTMYSVTMAIMSKRCYQDARTKSNLCIYITRAVLAIVMAISLLTLATFATYKRFHHDIYGYKGDAVEVDDSGLCNNLFLVKTSNPQYNLFMDLTASVAEWVLITGLLACICMYYFEFKDINMVRIQLTTNKSSEPVRTHPSLNRSVSQPNLSITSARTEYTAISVK